MAQRATRSSSTVLATTRQTATRHARGLGTVGAQRYAAPSDTAARSRAKAQTAFFARGLDATNASTDVTLHAR